MESEAEMLAGVPLRPGLILSMCTNTFFGRLIRMALGKSYKALTGDTAANCPSHDAIVIKHDNKLFIGDAVYPQCRRTTIWQYQVWLLDKKIYNLRVFEVHEISRMRQAMAAKWWDDTVANSPYDWPAYFRLTLKAIVGDWFPRAAGLRWARWCTESIKDAYAMGGCYDFYENANPTPLTTIKRWKEGRLKLMNPKQTPNAQRPTSNEE
jgi:hypothetical protein